MSHTNNAEYDSEFMSNFSPSLVHRIMLTSPSRLDHLTYRNGHASSPRQPTLTFLEVLHREGFLSNSNATLHYTSDIQQTPPSSSQLPALHDSISRTIMRAFHDSLLAQISQCQSYGPLLEIMLDMQSKLKSLVPHRKDLHEQFMVDSGEINRQLETFQGVVGLVCDFARKLIQLESPERSLSTQQWIMIAMDILSRCPEHEGAVEKDCNEKEQDGMLRFFCRDDYCTDSNDDSRNCDMREVQLSRKEFVVASSYFVHEKIVQCQSDVADFQFGHFLAPKIRAYGVEFLKRHFEEKFGIVNGMKHPLHEKGGLEGNGVKTTMEGENVSQEEDMTDNVSLLPHLKVWLTETIDTCSNTELQELIQSKEKREEFLIQRGWVDQILFRNPRSVHVSEGHNEGQIGNRNDARSSSDHSGDQEYSNAPNGSLPLEPFYMPEILYLDVDGVNSIRLAVKLAVVGSALALHASHVAGVGDAVLRQDPLAHNIQECRIKLIQAMGNKAIGSQELYERAIGDAVIELSKVFNPEFECDSVQANMIHSRTVATMRGEDPVLRLLDNRMRKVFREMMIFRPSKCGQVPTTLRTGRLPTASLTSVKNGESDSYEEVFQHCSKDEFIKNGFSFYAEELAEATLISHKIIRLAMHIHGDIVEQMFMEAIHNKNEN